MIDNNVPKFSYAEIGSVGVILERAGLSTKRNVAMHMHMTYEPHVLQEGKACITTEQGEYMLETGDLAVGGIPFCTELFTCFQKIYRDVGSRIPTRSIQ